MAHARAHRPAAGSPLPCGEPAGAGHPGTAGSGVCAACRPLLVGVRCSTCAPIRDRRACRRAAAAAYAGGVRRCLIAYQERGRRDPAPVLALALVKVLRELAPGASGSVLSVPPAAESGRVAPAGIRPCRVAGEAGASAHAARFRRPVGLEPIALPDPPGGGPGGPAGGCSHAQCGRFPEPAVRGGPPGRCALAQPGARRRCADVGGHVGRRRRVRCAPAGFLRTRR